MQKILLTENSMTSAEPITVTDFADLACATITGMVNQLRPIWGKLSAAERQKVTAHYFDSLNVSFSKCLENAFPEHTLRPDLTEQAILEAENKILKGE